MQECICGSGKSFGQCCEPLLAGRKKPRTLKQLVRSRYTAYALGSHEDYLLATWHPATRGRHTRGDLALPGVKWLGLEIISHEQKGDRGRVEFKATFADKAGELQVHHEHSVFIRLKGLWHYLDGEVYEDGKITKPLEI